MGIIDRICCWLDDLIIKIDILTFRLNQKHKEIEKRNNKE